MIEVEMGKIGKMMKREIMEVGLILMIHGGMIKSVMMTMFLKKIIWWIVLTPQQC
jgi:hypothetical protein